MSDHFLAELYVSKNCNRKLKLTVLMGGYKITHNPVISLIQLQVVHVGPTGTWMGIRIWHRYWILALPPPRAGPPMDPPSLCPPCPYLPPPSFLCLPQSSMPAKRGQPFLPLCPDTGRPTYIVMACGSDVLYGTFATVQGQCRGVRQHVPFRLCRND